MRRLMVATALSLVCGHAYAGGDEDTWSAPKKAVMHHQAVTVFTPPETIPVLGTVIEAPKVEGLVITVADRTELCHDHDIFAGNPAWYYKNCYFAPFDASSENPAQDNTSPQ